MSHKIDVFHSSLCDSMQFLMWKIQKIMMSTGRTEGDTPRFILGLKSLNESAHIGVVTLSIDYQTQKCHIVSEQEQVWFLSVCRLWRMYCG